MIVAGFGFRAGAGVESLADALARTGVAQLSALATAADKAAAPAFLALAERLKLPVRAIEPAVLARIVTPTQSAFVRSSRGIGSLAEAAALASIGPGARLIVSRVVSSDGMATCAIAAAAGSEGEDFVAAPWASI